MILIASSIFANYLFLPAILLSSVKFALSRQMPNSRTRKAGVTGSSPVAGSIAQDSRLWAAFLLSIMGARQSTHRHVDRFLLKNRKPHQTRFPLGKHAWRGRSVIPLGESRHQANNSAEQFATPPSKRLQAA